MKNMVMLKELYNHFYNILLYKEKMTALYSIEFILWDQCKCLQESKYQQQCFPPNAIIFQQKCLYIIAFQNKNKL